MVKTILKIFIFSVSIPVLFAQDVSVNRINSVYDGDTFRVDLNCDCPLMCDNIPIRVAGVDTPEMKSKCDDEHTLALQARNATIGFLRRGSVVLKNMKRGKYFRIVSEVYVNEESLSEYLISLKLGVSYYGARKNHDWCY